MTYELGMLIMLPVNLLLIYCMIEDTKEWIRASKNKVDKEKAIEKENEYLKLKNEIIKTKLEELNKVI